MKKMAEIMEELGFRPEASDEVKKAFIKNLIKEAHASEYKRAVPVKESDAKAKDSEADQYQQISLFDQKISS
jgi:hypothetical protein